MKKLTLCQWQSVPPSLVFTGEGVVSLKVSWSDLRYKKENIDPLTTIPNRRAFDEAAQVAVESSNKQGAGFGLIILDIDYFKQINDTYGHAAGDEALKMFASITQASLRNEDLLARVGGEEFAIITPTWDKAFEIGERVRQQVERLAFKIKNNESVKITCSFGSATYPNDAPNFQSLFELADQSLYKAKTTGRNKGVKGGK